MEDKDIELRTWNEILEEKDIEMNELRRTLAAVQAKEQPKEKWGVNKRGRICNLARKCSQSNDETRSFVASSNDNDIHRHVVDEGKKTAMNTDEEDDLFGDNSEMIDMLI